MSGQVENRSRLSDRLVERDAVLDQIRRGVMSRAEVDAVLVELAAAANAGRTAPAALLLEILDTSPILRSAVRSVLFGDADVDDALQETLLAVSRSLHTFRGDSSLLTWAAAIARNKARDILRRKGRPASPDPVADIPTELHRFTSQWASHADVEHALDGLSDKLRVVFQLADVEGFSYDEIAGQLGIERNTVASRLRRARAQLGLALSPEP